MLKVEGIAFRFLPDPVQIKNALEVSSSCLMTSIYLSFCGANVTPFLMQNK